MFFSFGCFVSIAGTGFTDPILTQSIIVSVKNNSATISWQVSQATGVRRYELEKSLDGVNFFYLTAMSANTVGFSEKNTALDENVAEGKNFYRLKTVYANGSYEYQSNTAFVNNLQLFTPTILPQVTDKSLYIWMPDNRNIAQINITDAAGRQMLQLAYVKVVANLAEISLGNLAQGVYYANVVSAKNEQAAILKFAKK